MVRRTHIKVEVEPPVFECLDQRFHGREMVLGHEDSRNMRWASGARQNPVQDFSHSVGMQNYECAAVFLGVMSRKTRMAPGDAGYPFVSYQRWSLG